MKSFPVLFVLLATAMNSEALVTPPLRIRRQDSSDNATADSTASLCGGAGTTLVSSSSLTVDGFANTLQLSTFECANDLTSNGKLISAQSDSLLGGLLGGLLGILFPPCPPVTPSVSAKTTTVVKTTTATKTSTTTKTSTKTSTKTKTSTATATKTSVVTSVSATTATETTTETDTDTLTITSTVSASAPSSSASDVCGEICTIVCGEQGQLPPDEDDCQQLVNAITILNGEIAPEFTVQPNHVQTISFGTCQFYFENVSPIPLDYCWLSLTQVASAAASQCLPPTQPVMSLGLCISSSAFWEVGVAHA